MVAFIKCSFVFLFIGTILIFACKRSETTPNGYIELGDNESVNLSEGITIRADSILDSRCPEGALCIVAGSIDAVIFFTKNNAAASTRLTSTPLYLKDKGVLVRRDSATILLGNQPITVILRDVVPHRTVSDTRSTGKKAAIQVLF